MKTLIPAPAGWSSFYSFTTAEWIPQLEIAKYILHKTKAKLQLGKLDGLLCCLSKLRFNMESEIRFLQLVEC